MGLAVTEACLEVLTVLSWPGIGAARARTILRALRPGQSVLEAARQAHADRVLGVADAPAGVPYVVANMLQTCQSVGIEVLCMLDAEYPEKLKAIIDAPPILYVRGRALALCMRSIAVVGTRQASTAGKRSAHGIAEYLAGRGCSVVSGLALGIDTAAHVGALEGKGATVAVLAHGLDTVAPTSNRALANRILESGGALVSEHPPGTPPRPPEFARRNRIQSGLSDASIIVESGAEGGAMIQAKFTHEQGRVLCAVLSEDPEHNRAGAERLIREFGARPIRRRGDLDALLTGESTSPPDRPGNGAGQLEFEW